MSEIQKIGQDSISEHIPIKTTMVSGTKYGLIILAFYSVFILMVIAANLDVKFIQNLLDTIPDELGGVLLGMPLVLISVCGLITGFQKGRRILGIVAFLLGPLGFIIAALSENRKDI